MDVRGFVGEAFRELEEDLNRALDGLSPEELAWRPDVEANSIGFTFWHLSRAEDVWVNGFALQRANLFERGGWAKRWNIPPGDTGFRYTAEQLARFPSLPLGELWEYHRAVRRETADYLSRLANADFDPMPPTDNPRRRGYTIGRMFSHLVCELGQHVGHVAYLRGLQRGINK